MKIMTFFRFLSSVVGFVLAACAPTVQTAATLEPTGLASPTNTPAPTAAALSFVPAMYRDEANAFELDYPAEWSLDPSSQVGSRGAQAQLFSPGATSETLPDGGSRVSITVYSWDPKNDLAAYVTQRKTAWEASGFKIIRESKGNLVDGRKEMDFIVQSPDNLQAFFLFTTNAEGYLQIAGEGNLALIEEIARTLRPLNFKP